jgi:diaminopimelate decarboxylase
VWPAGTRRLPDGGLGIGGIALAELARRYGTPLQVLDEADLRARCRAFTAAVPDADVYYAGKAFLSTEIVRIVAREGLRLDVCSGGELAVALAGGMTPDHIAFHGNNKSVAELEQAVDAGVGRFVIDSLQEVDRLSAIARRAGRRARVLIRVTPGVSAHTHEHIATAHEDQKFGLSIADGSALEAVRRVLDLAALDLRGLHCHIGSQIFDDAGHRLAATRVLDLYAALRVGLGVTLPEVNLGGGFGIAYTAGDDPRPAWEMARDLCAIVADLARARALPPPRPSFEPGRAVIGPAMATLYEVGTVKQVAGLRTYVSVDGGMSDNIRTALYQAEYTVALACRTSAAGPVPARVVGKHCESGDILVRDCLLPGDVRPGDLLAVAATGAYCRSLASNYNYAVKPAVVAVDEGRARVILRRETIEDLLRLDTGAVRGKIGGPRG